MNITAVLITMMICITIIFFKYNKQKGKIKQVKIDENCKNKY